jgi:2,4-dienoyl-CoA reductase-like NADH-dependent reductase (Old Yellow Enzyme family)
MGPILDHIRRYSNMPLAIQLSHAGRKASCDVPWQGGTPLPFDHINGWQTQAPSAVPFDRRSSTPIALDAAGLIQVRDAFAAAAMRAGRLSSMGGTPTDQSKVCASHDDFNAEPANKYFSYTPAPELT